MPRDYRTGRITIEQAKQKFNDYYDNKKYKTPLGAFKAKLYDKMYKKKDRFLIKCNNTDIKDDENDIEPGWCEKGSVKYLLEEGPKTFDAQHVDAFPEGEKIELTLPDGSKSIHKSLGYTTKRSNDSTDKIYGPRVTQGAVLYSKFFGDQYRTKNPTDSLVNKYWREYEKQKKAGKLDDNYKRKNTKNTSELLLEFMIGASTYDLAEDIIGLSNYEELKTKPLKLFSKDQKINIKLGRKILNPEEDAEDRILYDILTDYLEHLDILSSDNTFNTELKEVKLYSLTFKKLDRRFKDLEGINLNISTGNLTYDADIDNQTFKKWYDTWETKNTRKPQLLDFWNDEEGYEDRYHYDLETAVPAIQTGGYIETYIEGEYSSSWDDYSIYSSDEE